MVAQYWTNFSWMTGDEIMNNMKDDAKADATEDGLFTSVRDHEKFNEITFFLLAQSVLNNLRSVVFLYTGFTRNIMRRMLCL